jgi:hypothetical protein
VTEPPYNPLERRPLAESVANALLTRPRGPLPPGTPFSGAGIYALYFEGGLEPYRSLLESSRTPDGRPPIYVGKAIPAGSSTGGLLSPQAVGPVLYSRLLEHAESIEQSSNLDIAEFSCRYLTVDDIWIPLGENLLIETFQPLWNKKVRGFGNHTPGAGRSGQRRSAWDEMHPGRRWVEELGLAPAAHNAGEIAARLREGLPIANEPSEDDGEPEPSPPD